MPILQITLKRMELSNGDMLIIITSGRKNMSRYSAILFVMILISSSCANYTQNGETLDVLDSSIRDDYTQLNVVSNFISHPPIATGDSTTCVILNDKNISCWGYNSNGKLGNGSLEIIFLQKSLIRHITLYQKGLLSKL